LQCTAQALLKTSGDTLAPLSGFPISRQGGAVDELAKHIHEILAMDRSTLGVICALCLVSAFALKDYLANPIMVVFAWPVLFLCSVLAQYSFMLLQVYAPNKLDQWLMWTVIASICGNMIGIAVVAGLGRLRDATTATAPTAKAAGATQNRR
jgi:hypothetical protein